MIYIKICEGEQKKLHRKKLSISIGSYNVNYYYSINTIQSMYPQSVFVFAKSIQLKGGVHTSTLLFRDKVFLHGASNSLIKAKLNLVLLAVEI